jgi:hypothetical protein
MLCRANKLSLVRKLMKVLESYYLKEKQSFPLIIKASKKNAKTF